MFSKQVKCDGQMLKTSKLWFRYFDQYDPIKCDPLNVMYSDARARPEFSEAEARPKSHGLGHPEA